MLGLQSTNLVPGTLTNFSFTNGGGFTGIVTNPTSTPDLSLTIADTRVTASLLTGYVVGTNTPLSATDSILSAFGNVQAQINAINLSTDVYKIAYYEEVGTASGAITIPTGSTILLNQLPAGADALVSTVNVKPTGENPKTAGGAQVDVSSFDALGNYVLTGTPSAFPVAIIFWLAVPASDYSNLNIQNILEEEIGYAQQVRSTLLTDVVITNSAIVETDNVLQGFGKAQGQMNQRVVGPAIATDRAIAIYNGTTGKIIQNSGVTIAVDSTIQIPKFAYIESFGLSILQTDPNDSSARFGDLGGADIDVYVTSHVDQSKILLELSTITYTADSGAGIHLFEGASMNAGTSFNVFNSGTTTIHAFGVATTLSIGNFTGAAQTVNMFASSTGASTYNFATGATLTATTKTINIGTVGVSGSTTNINIGSAVSGALGTVTINENTLINKHLGVGATSSISPSVLINCFETFTSGTDNVIGGTVTLNTSSGTDSLTGYNVITSVNGTSAAAPSTTGISVLTTIGSTNTVNWAANALKAQTLRIRTVAGGSGTITDATYLQMISGNWGASKPVAFWGHDIQNLGSSGITTSIAINIQAQSGSTNNYAIASASGNLHGFGTIVPASTLEVGGSFCAAYVAKTANYTATILDYTIDCTSNTFTVTLPTAVGITGRIYNIKNSGAGTITVDGGASETIDGNLTISLTQFSSAMIQSTGTNWIIL